MTPLSAFESAPMTDEPDRPDKPALQERDTTDSDCARWVAEFTADLRRMHEEAGKPSSRQMSRRAGYSHTALLGALAGTGRRLPSLELTLGLVQACRGDEQAWRARWHQEQARITAHALSRDHDLSARQALPDGRDVPSRPRRRLRRILLPALGVVVALAIGGVVLEFTTHGGSAPPTYGLGGALPTCEQSGADVYQLAAQVPRSFTSQQMKECIATFSKGSPQQPGPWPFFVYDTIVTPEDVRLGLFPPVDLYQDIGVKVRTTSTSEAQNGVGTVKLGSVVWADCYVHSAFHPIVPPSDDVGPTWLRIHWDSTSAFSSPTDPVEAYVYAGYTLPFTHNGKIPTCT